MYVLTKCVAIKIAVVFFFPRSSPLRIYFSNRRYDTLKGVATKNLPPQTHVDMTAANWQRSPFLFSSGTSIASKSFPQHSCGQTLLDRRSWPNDSLRCTYPRLPTLLYAPHRSETMVVPGRMNCWMIGRVAASLLSTGTMKPAFVWVSIPPKTHCSRIIRPRLYFRRVKTLSSICTVWPTPPIRTGWATKYSPHTSRKNIFQSTKVCWLIPNSLLAFLNVRSS